MANGPWTVVIQGSGPYQNLATSPDAIYSDVDQLLVAFIQTLEAAGHVIIINQFVVGNPASVTISGAFGP